MQTSPPSIVNGSELAASTVYHILGYYVNDADLCGILFVLLFRS